MHITTRTPLSRRTFLRAAGVTLALPFLESMMPRLGAATDTGTREYILVATVAGTSSMQSTPFLTFAQ